MEFTKNAPQWDAVGVEPTDELKQNGFVAGYKPPAEYFNYLFNNYTYCIKEIQQILSNVESNIVTQNYMSQYSKVGTCPYNAPKYAVVKNDEIHILSGKYLSEHYYYHKKWDGTEWSDVSTLVRRPSVPPVVYNDEIYLMASDGRLDKWDGTAWSTVFYVGDYYDEDYTHVRGLAVLNNELHILLYSSSNETLYHFKYVNGTATEILTKEIYEIGYQNMVHVFNDELYIVNCMLTSEITTSLKFNGEDWEQTDFTVPNFNNNTTLVEYKNRIYAFSGSSSTKSCAVYDGSNWLTLSNMPNKLYPNAHAIVVMNDNIHLLGLSNYHYIYSDTNYIENISNLNNYYVENLYGKNFLIEGNTVNNYTLGNDNIGNGNQMLLGHYNDNTLATGGYTAGIDGTGLCIGNGTEETRANAFRVNYDGSVYGLSSFMSSGADFAEFREWLDGNENNEDRVGYFVTRDGVKIRKANAGEYVAGVTSGNPCLIGNSDECWKGKYIVDDFNRFVEETYEFEVEETDVFTGEVTKVTKVGAKYKINPEYDPEQEYISRANRKEWAYVCMRGEIAVYDDGTCEVNGYCKVADGGKATAAQVTEYSYLTPIYRVVDRVTENIVKIEY